MCFQGLSRIAASAGADFPDYQHYQNKGWFTELLFNFDLVAWEFPIQGFKGASMVSLHIDGADGFFLIRLGLLCGATWKATTVFWQARHTTSKTAEACWQALRRAFLELPHKHLSKWYIITECEWLGKIGGLVGDGATEIG